MGVPQKYQAEFNEHGFYHVYNRTNNKEPLFLSDSDRNLFLSRFEFYTANFIDNFAWNLLTNHFHFYIRIKSHDEIHNYLKKLPQKKICRTEKRFLKQKVGIHQLIDNAFKRLFISYTIRFNKKYERKGNLFHRPFKRVVTLRESQFIQTIIYINANAVKHNLVKNISEHIWSSYHNIISEKKSNKITAEILEEFGGLNEFIRLHEEIEKYCFECETAPDDD